MRSKHYKDTDDELHPCKEDGLWGFCDSKRNLVIFYKYTSVREFVEGLSIVNKDYCYNSLIIDKAGNELKNCIYEILLNFSDGLSCCLKSGNYYEKFDHLEPSSWGYIDLCGKEVIPFHFEEAEDFIDGLALVKDHFSYYFISKDGKDASKRYQRAFSFVGDFATIVMNEKLGLINKKCEEIVSCKYDEINDVIIDGMILVESNGKCGYLDIDAIEKVPCKYDFLSYFSEGLAFGGLEGKNGFVNKNGDEIIEFKYKNTNSFIEGLALVELTNKSGFIDINGKIAIPLIYDPIEYLEEGYPTQHSTSNEIGNFHHGLARVKLNGKVGYINNLGESVIECIYADLGFFSEALTCAQLNQKVGFIDQSGKEIIPFMFDIPDIIDYENPSQNLLINNDYVFKNGTAKVKFKGRFGLINKNGKFITTKMYDKIGYFIEGRAQVSQYENKELIDELRNDFKESKFDDFDDILEEPNKVIFSEKLGLIDEFGKEIIDCKYDEIYSLNKEFICVVLSKKIGLIGKEGNKISDCIYEEISCFSEGLARVKSNGRYGFIDRNGKIVISCIWFYAQSFSDGLSRVRFQDESELFDRTGQQPLSSISKEYLFSDNLFTLINENYGFIDKKGFLKINCTKYSRVNRFIDGLAVVELEDVSKRILDLGLIDRTGREVVNA